MLRFLMAAFAATALLLAACGGGNDKPSTDPTTAGTAAPTATTSSGLQQPTAADVVLPTPTPAADDSIALTVVAGKQTYNPTVSEFRALDTAKITAAGQDYTGVAIGTLAAKVSAPAEAVVTIQGTRADGKRASLLRYGLSEIGTTTILTISDSGHLTLESTSIDKTLWIIDVTSVAFQ